MLNVEIETTINVELSSKFELGSVFINASIVEAVNGMGHRSLRFLRAEPPPAASGGTMSRPFRGSRLHAGSL